MSGIASTYKARDVEEGLDVYFYRPLGYVCARVAQRLGLSPNAVTLTSAAVGITAGHLFFYPSLRLNVLGMLLLVFSETLDSADGQLARLAGSFSPVGRILDGLASNLIFISVYCHLALRCAASLGPAWIAVLVLLAAASHSLQCAAADYYRNAFLHLVHGAGKAELDPHDRVVESYRRLAWRREPVRKLLLRLYVHYTREQELLTRSFLDLLRAVDPGGAPDWLAGEYRQRSQPLIKYYNILTANTRMLALLAALLAGAPSAYLLFEIVPLNLLLLYVLARQNRGNRELTERLKAEARPC